MSTPQITLADCLAEVNNALNYWYPIKGEAESGGASREECDARHVRLFQFRDRLQQQLREAGKAAAFDLAMVMAELRSVAAERDKSRQSLRAAEQDVAEMESASSDLRTVNARLVADLAAATQRAETAEAILRAKA